MRKKLLRNQAGHSYSKAVEAKPMAGFSFTASGKFPDDSLNPTIDYRAKRLAGVYDGQNIWMSTNGHARSLLKLHGNGYISYPSVESGIPRSGGCYDGTYIWFMPYAGIPLTRLDPETGEVVAYPADTAYSGEDCTYDGRYIWAIGNGTIIRIDPQDGSISGTGCRAYNGMVLDDDANLWSGITGHLVRYNTEDESYEQYELPLFSSNSCFPVWDGHCIWILSPYVSKVYKFDPDTERLTIYYMRMGTNVGHYTNEIGTRPNFPMAAAFDGKYIWLAPKVGGLRLLRIDTADGSMEGFEINNTGYQIDNTDLLTLFEDIVYDGNKLILVPVNVPRISYVVPTSTLNGVYEEYVDQDGNRIYRDTVQWIEADGTYNGIPRNLGREYLGYKIDDGNLQTGDTVSVSAVGEQHIVTFVYGDEYPVDPEYPLTHLEAALVLQIGDHAQLTKLPEDTGAWSWNTSDASVATVDSNGLLTAVSDGKVYVTVSDTSGQQNAQICISVGGQGFGAVPVAQAGDVRIAVTLQTGDTVAMKALPVPENTTDFILWRSSNASMAHVTEEGVVTVMSEGQAKIYCSNESGSIMDNITVLVPEAEEPEPEEPEPEVPDTAVELIADGYWTANVTTQPGSLRRSDGAVVCEGKVYIIGGSYSATSYNDVNIYDPKTNQWAIGNARPVGASGMATGLYNKKIYTAAGKANNVATNEMYIYDVATDNWEQGPSMPSIIGEDGFSWGFMANGKFHVIGQSALLSRQKHYIYDPVTEGWSSGASLSALSGAVLITSDGTLVGSDYYLFTYRGAPIHIYNTITDSWRKGVSIPYTTNDGYSVATIGKQIMLMCGNNYQTTGVNNEVYIFDTESEQYTQIDSMPVPKSAFTSALVDQQLYTFINTRFAQVDRYTIPNSFLVTEQYVTIDGAELHPADDTLVGLGWNQTFDPIPLSDNVYRGYRIDGGSLISERQVTLENIQNCHTITYVYGEPDGERPLTEIETVLIIRVGETAELQADFTPEDTTDEIVWRSTDEAVAAVEDGIVTGISEGKAYVSSSNESDLIRSMIPVRVVNSIPNPTKPVELTNLLKNPDFSQNWTATSGTVASAGGVGTVSNATASARNLQLYQSGFRFDAGHKYYLRSSFRTTASGSATYCQIGASQDGLLSQHATEDTWSHKSFVYDGDVVSGSVIRLIFSWSSVVSLAGQTFEVFEPLFIDLTQAFGAGQEPDAEWCHNNIPFFDGTTTITI